MFIDITIEGKSPLLMNRFTEDAQEQATTGRSTFSNGDRGTSREQAERKLYKHNGEIGIPQPNLFRCIVEGGRCIKIGREKLSTRDRSIIPACVEIADVFLPLKHEGWEVYSLPVVIPATKGRIINHRPAFEKWALDFHVELDIEELSPGNFRDVVDAAGKKIGLGDFRPDRKGPFGRFVVVRWDESE